MAIILSLLALFGLVMLGNALYIYSRVERHEPVPLPRGDAAVCAKIVDSGRGKPFVCRKAIDAGACPCYPCALLERVKEHTTSAVA